MRISQPVFARYRRTSWTIHRISYVQTSRSKRFDTVIRPDVNRYKHKAFTNPPKDSLPSACGARLWQPFSPPDGGDQRLPRGPDQLPVLAGLTVSIINPRCMPHFARNTNMRSKAGKVDARFGADYAYCDAARLRRRCRMPLDRKKSGDARHSCSG